MSFMRKKAKAPGSKSTDDSGQHQGRITDECSHCHSDIYLVGDTWIHDDDSGSGLPHQAMPVNHEVNGSGKTYLDTKTASNEEEEDDNEEFLNGITRGEYKRRAAESPAPEVYPPKNVLQSSSREHGTTYRQVGPDDAEYHTRGAFHTPSPDEEFHGPYRVIKHPETGRFHVVDNQDRVTRYGGRDGQEHQHNAEYFRDMADQRQSSKEKAKGLADKLWEGTAQIFDPGSTPDSRRGDRYMHRMTGLMDRYEGGNHHPLHPGKFDYDDEEEEGDKNGQPYYEVKDPGGSGFTARDYGGPNVHIYHEATPDEAHDLIDEGSDETRNSDHQEKPAGYGHDELHQTLHNWIHGAPADPRYPDDVDPATGRQWSSAKYISENEPRIQRYQRRKGFKFGMRTQAYGETKAPIQVDTLRDAECPVCGDTDSFDGDQCQVCGYVAPPTMFRDPDLDKAKLLDLRNNPATGMPNDQDPNVANPMDNQNAEVQPGMDPNDPNAAPGAPDADSGIVQPEVQALGDVPLDPNQVDANGNPVDMSAATGRVPQGGDIFQQGPDAPQAQQFMEQGGAEDEDEPMDPADVMAEDEAEGVPEAADGQPFAPGAEPDPGAPGTPGDGVPDLMCPSCGFQADAATPMATSTDINAPSNAGDGMQAGDVCPNCQQAPLMSVGEMEQMQATEQAMGDMSDQRPPV